MRGDVDSHSVSPCRSASSALEYVFTPSQSQKMP